MFWCEATNATWVQRWSPRESLVTGIFFLPVFRGVLGWLRHSRSVYGRSLPLRGGLDRSGLRPAGVQPSLHQTWDLQGWQVPVSPRLERGTLHYRSASLWICVCTCERVWCVPAYQLRGWAEAPSQTWLRQLLSTSLREFRNEKRLRKADHRGFARECWRDGRIERECVSIRIKLTSVTVVPRAHGGTKAFSYRTWSHGHIFRC